LRGTLATGAGFWKIMTNADDSSFALEGATNFRSLGGLPAAGGLRIRPHLLMRADRLVGLSQADWGTLARAGLSTICDLRSEAERAEHPNRVPPSIQVHELNCEVNNDLRADPSLGRLMLDDPTARGAERVMIEIYRRFPGYMGATLTRIAARLIEGGAPLLVHCSAGKDRTGFVVAMLLHALEVPDELIRADYLASRHWPGAVHHREALASRLGRFMPEHEVEAAVDTVIDVRDVYLDSAMEALRAEFGSVQSYLEAAAGLDAARIDRLRERLLE
jgi:protein-tyrosine phosphatase